MRKVCSISFAIAVAAIALTIASTTSAGDCPASAAHASTVDVVATADQAGDFSTLLTAIRAAGLEDALKGPGPFTVFAPTDAAFAKLPPGSLDGLLEDKARLTEVLTYHVVPGKFMAADVVKVTQVKTLEGQSLRVQAGDGVKVDEANVVKTDIVASNGIIHVIDAVVIPN